MPPQRTSRGASELTPLQRARPHGMSIAGMLMRAIADHFGVNHTTIVRTVNSYHDKNEYKSAPRSRPRATTERTDRRLRREARASYDARCQPLGQLHHNVMPNQSRKTVQRRLQEDNVQKWRAAERPLLESKHKQQRLEWAQRYRHYKAEDWAVVV